MPWFDLGLGITTPSNKRARSAYPSSPAVFSLAPCFVPLYFLFQTNTTTILKEYYPGMNRLMYGVVGGNYEADKHESALQVRSPASPPSLFALFFTRRHACPSSE